jgi:type I restriction enzyme S subunit
MKHMSGSPEPRRTSLRDVTLKTRTWNPFSEARETIRYVDVSTVSRETLEISNVAEIPGVKAPSRARKIIESGDTIFATIRPSLKRVAQVPDSLHGEVASTAFCILRPNRNVVDPEFLFFVASNDAFVDEVAFFETGASYPAVPDSDVLDQEIPLPPLPDQRLIARVLGTARIALLHQSKSLAASEDLKRAAMRELFTRGLRGEALKETEIGLVPESWDVLTLSEIATIERGRFLYRPRNEPRFYGGKTPFVQTGDVVRSAGRIREFTQTLNDEGVAISKVFPAGTILLTIAANIGYTGVLQFSSACPDSLVAITPSEGIDTLFLEYFLQTQQLEMDRRAPKGTQKNINIQFLSPWPIPLPPPHEQHEIVEILDAIDRKIDLHKRKRAVLEDLFKSLLHKLMTGEIRVADLNLSALKTAEKAEAAE